MKAIVILILAFCWVFGANSQSLLFEVGGTGMQHPVYVFGTAHAIPSSKFFIEDIVIEKLEKSKKLIFEIDVSDPNLMLEMVPLMTMQGKTINDLLTPEEFEVVNRFYIDSLKIPFGFMANIKPLLVSSMMIPHLIGEEMASYEDFLKNKAKSLEIPIGGLETVEQQMGYIDRVSVEDQARMLYEQVNEVGQTRTMMKQMFEKYHKNDAQLLYEFVSAHTASIREFGDYLLAERNQNWVPLIIRLGAEQPTFVAVGAGHLGGKKGVINLLRQAGFTVKPLKQKR